MAKGDKSEGQADSIKGAADKAWDEAKRKGAKGGTWFTVEIEAKGENPITSYRVILTEK